MREVLDSMLSGIDKYMFFIASFSPLWIIMMVGYALDNQASQYLWPAVTIPSAATTVSVLLIVRKFRALRRSTNAKKIKVEEAHEVTVKYIPYIMSYLFLILVEIDDLGTLVVVVASLALVGTLYVKTSMVLTNPALLLVGFRVYKVRATDYDRPITIISKRYPENTVKVRDVDHDLCITQKKQNH